MHCDNAGENKLFEELSKKEGLSIKFEYTSPGSTQQNGERERKFASLYGKVRSMLNGACLTPNLRHGLWTECAACATMEENILLSDKSPVPPYKLFFGVDAPLSKNLHTFGKIGIIKMYRRKSRLSWIIVAPLVSLLDIIPLMKLMCFVSMI